MYTFLHIFTHFHTFLHISLTSPVSKVDFAVFLLFLTSGKYS